MSSISNDQSGIILTLASSLTCILGSMVIYSDVVWRWIFPSTKFDLHNNENFLVCSLSLSSGILLFTSMYKLLPEGLKYFNESSLFENSPRAAHFTMIGSFFLGVVVCSVINAVIHTLTSQSVVHCLHDGDDHSHTHDTNPPKDYPHQTHDHHHTHEHNNDHHHHHHDHHDHDGHHGHLESSFTDVDNIHDLDSTEETDESANIPSCSTQSSTFIDSTNTALDATNEEEEPLLPNHKLHFDPKRKQSLLDITEWTLRRKKSMGICMGYTSAGSCTEHCKCQYSDNDPHEIYDYVNPQTGTHSHDHIAVNGQGSVHSEGYGSLSHTEHGDISVSPRTKPTETIAPIVEPDLESQSDLDVLHHHHHVSTRYSHLFSIGAQTAFAISVHKVPEGILTVATSHANKELGFSVFISLAIHNFSEGFTIAFPLFLALGSRGIALTAAIVLGGLSQPFGGFLAWLFFHFQKTPPEGSDGTSNFVFGLIVSITAGFLFIIGLQMYGTAISFGGQQRLTLFCAFVGIAFIGTGYSLTAK